MGFFLASIAFIINPLIFSATNAKLLSLIVTSTNNSGIPLGTFKWIETDSGKLSIEIASAALTGAQGLLSEITSLDDDKRRRFTQIQLEDKQILAEHREKFTGFLICQNPDEICRIALRYFIKQQDQRYADKSVERIFQLEPESFKKDVLNTFIFAQIQHKVENL